MQAGRAGLRGTFRAFLSSGERSLENIVRYRDRDLPVVNIKGEVFYSAWRDIFHDPSQPLLTSHPLYSFSRKDVLNSSSWAVLGVPTTSLQEAEFNMDELHLKKFSPVRNYPPH